MSVEESPEFEFLTLPRFHFSGYPPRHFLDEIQSLLPFLTKREIVLTTPYAGEVLSQLHLYTVVCYDKSHGNKLVGMATMAFVSFWTGPKAFIEDVVVHGDYRGKKLGRLLMERLFELARANQAGSVWMGDYQVQLTSNPNRAEANILYQRLGMEKIDTNVYRLTLKKA